LRLTTKVISLSFLGGAVGTWLRWFIAEGFDDLIINTNESARSEQVLTSTIVMLFVVNLTGAAALGFFNSSRFFQTDSRQAFFGVGLAGGYTTMSGVALWLLVTSGNASLFGLGAWFNFALVLAMFIGGILVYRLATKWVR
jgi:fluoride ion exporter CrcB/FEX